VGSVGEGARDGGGALTDIGLGKSRCLVNAGACRSGRTVA
jgi:hypothetical protein